MSGMTAPRAVPTHREPIIEPHDSDNDAFDTALRGYDRRQVDRRIRELTDQLALLHSASRKAEAASATAASRARSTEEKLQAARSELAQLREAGSDDARSGFGYRAERILRAAQHEAAELRASAAQEVAALVEQARADAEQKRHELEQQLIQRAAVQDHEAAQRNADIRGREQAAAAAVEAARQEAEEVRSSAVAAAQALRTDAEAHAKDIRLEVERYVRQQKEVAQRELERLASVGSDARAELDRLRKLLAAELQSYVDSPQSSTRLPDG
jgi:chromosome segregation ATPase